MAIATVNGCSILEGFELAYESLLYLKGLKALQTMQALSK
jgi:hypothetical protein